MIPVGPGTLGRIMNVTGDPIDERGPIKATKKLPIHADPPEFVDQSTSAEILVTGIKVVDLLAPYARGGKIGLFGGAGVGKTVFIQELIVCGHLFAQRMMAMATSIAKAMGLQNHMRLYSSSKTAPSVFDDLKSMCDRHWHLPLRINIMNIRHLTIATEQRRKGSRWFLRLHWCR